MYQHLAIIALFVLVYSAISGRVERTWVSAPVVATLFGLGLGPYGLGYLTLSDDPGLIRTLAELALALVLFTDAAGADLNILRRRASIPARLILLALPMTIALGWLIAAGLAPDISLLELALLATMLAPTDAALGKSVINDPSVPDHVREALNAESGLNDGVCVPVLFFFLAEALHTSAGESASQLIAVGLAEEIGIGLVLGLLLAQLALWLLAFCDKRGWLAEQSLPFPVTALAIASFAAAQAFGGSGFIAAFAGGMLFGARQHDHREALLSTTEGSADALSVITWVIFGAVVVGEAIGAVVGETTGEFDWIMLLYAVLSLTVVRMLPTFVSLTGLGLSTETKLFVGWFGPRGLASIVFAVIVIEAGLPNAELLALVVALTVVLSIVAHGFSAKPWARGYGRREREKGKIV